MYRDQENVYYYLTVMNEKYPQPDMPEGAEAGILRGMYKLKDADSEGQTKAKGKGRAKRPRVQLLGSGTILREVIAAAEMLDHEFGVAADVWSVTSFNELARDGQDTDRWNLLHPEEEKRLSYVERQLSKSEGPVIAATDYMRAYSEQIRAYVPCNVPGDYRTLGTDGWGRSDSREKLRKFFEVHRDFIYVAALSALADRGDLDKSRVSEAIAKLGIDPDRPSPRLL
jgi:pyruvate dehydrogenase E1 component